jgi:tetratricopeptide (TPR) repeat protein
MLSDQCAQLMSKIQEIMDASGDSRAHLEWGTTYKTLNKPDDAGREFQCSRLPEGQVLWGTLLAGQGNANLAKEKFLRAFELAGEAAKINLTTDFYEYQYVLLTVLLKADHPAELIDRIEGMVGNALSGWWAELLCRLNRPENALAPLERALRHGPTIRLREAFSQFRIAAKDDPALLHKLVSIILQNQRETTYPEAVDFLIEVKRYPEAFQCCSAWTKTEPQNSQAFEKLGQVYSARKQFAEATGAFKKAAELAPESPYYPGAGQRLQVYQNWLQAIEAQDLEAGAVKKLATAFDGRDTAVNWQEVERAQDMRPLAFMELFQELEAYVDSRSEHDQIVYALDRDGLTSQALSLLKRTHMLAPETLVREGFFYNWGRLLSSLGDNKGAIVKFRRAVVFNKKWHYPYFEIARCYERKQQYRHAAAAYQRAIDRGTEFYGADKNSAKAEIYISLTRVFCELGKYDEALEKSRLALELKPSDYWARFQRAYTLARMQQYEQAIVEYDLASQNGAFPHAHHNVWDLLERQGRYREARQKLVETRQLYENNITTKLRERDAYYCLYYSWACSANYDRDERKAEDLLRAAILFDPNNADFRVSLAKLYFERAKTEADLRSNANAMSVAEAAPSVVPARLKAIEHYRTAEQLLNRRLGFHRTVALLLDLGELQLLNDNWDKAKEAFEEAIRLDPESIRGHKGRAQALLNSGDSAAAVRQLKAVIKRDPMDLSVMLLLAQARRRAGQLEEAEIGYRRVLEIAQFHIDALVGLGELYLDMAEKRGGQKNAAVAEFCTKAITCLDRAISLFGSENAPLIIGSKPASTYYLLGYAQVKLYETSVLRRDRSLVAKALKNFSACLAQDKFHVRATRAMEGIKEDQRTAKTDMERYAGPAIMVMAFLVFALAQFGLLVGRPVHPQALMLTPTSLEAVKADGLSGDLIEKLGQVANAEFETDEKFAAKAKELIGAENFTKYGASLIEHMDRKVGAMRLQTIDLGSYALLSLGSLLVIMAGAVLPQLTSLKLAGLQLEKASSERIETRSTLAIEPFAPSESEPFTPSER